MGPVPREKGVGSVGSRVQLSGQPGCLVTCHTPKMRRAVATTRLSYTASEVGGQLIFSVISFYLLKFYTDVYGITAAAAGSILLFARCFDAFDAPMWGILFDKTQSRWGKSRPWFLWLCVPFAISGVLTFVTPNFGNAGKIAYAAGTYVLCSVLYTGINTPVTSILSALTPHSGERVTLTSFRMVGSKLGVLLVNLSLLGLVAWLGRGDAKLGFMRVMPMYAAGSVLLFLLAFRNLKETTLEPRQSIAVRSSFRALRGNHPWCIIAVSSLLFWVAFIARISSAPYFFEYVLHRADLVSIANSLDVVSLGSILWLPALCRRFSKRDVWLWSLMGAALSQGIVHLGGSRGSVPLVLFGWILGFLTSGLAMAMPFSLLCNSVDYGEWKTGVRAAGMLTAVGIAFCLKAGSGLGGALPAWLLSRYDYVPNVSQSPRAITGIDLSCVWLPALSYALAAVPVLFYRRYERMEEGIQQELQERRDLAAAVSSSV